MLRAAHRRGEWAAAVESRQVERRALAWMQSGGGRQWIEWGPDEIAPHHPHLFRAGRARRGMQAIFDLAL